MYRRVLPLPRNFGFYEVLQAKAPKVDVRIYLVWLTLQRLTVAVQTGWFPRRPSHYVRQYVHWVWDTGRNASGRPAT
jgi:hypothetical protein